MSGVNSFGQFFRITTFGESHGPGLGVVVDGCPAGVVVTPEDFQRQLDRRRPGQKDPSSQQVLVTSRDEADQLHILSGIYENKTLGTPVACVVYNQNQKSQDYEKISQSPRYGHADDVWKKKFSHVDFRGGGRSSGRETVSRVIAGVLAERWLSVAEPSLRVLGFVKSIGEWSLDSQELMQLQELWKNTGMTVDSFAARFPTSKVDMVEVLLKAKEMGESYGGVIEVWIDGIPAGLGEPVFYKLKNVLASAMMSIGATCGFEIGDGFLLSRQKGTEVHSPLRQPSPYGGVRGGISTGEKIVFRVAFKPTSSILDVAKKGRHDPCIVPRAVPVVEAMTWLVLADMHRGQSTFGTHRI